MIWKKKSVTFENITVFKNREHLGCNSTIDPIGNIKKNTRQKYLF